MKQKNASMCEMKIVSIDTNKALEAHPAFKEAVLKFKGYQQEMQKKLRETEKEQQPVAQQQLKQQLEQVGGQLQKEAFSEMKKDVQQQAEEKGYDYVLDDSMLIAGGRDVTEEIIKSFEEKSSTE